MVIENAHRIDVDFKGRFWVLLEELAFVLFDRRAAADRWERI